MIDLCIACVLDRDIAWQIEHPGESNSRLAYDRSVVLALRKIYKRVHLISAIEGNSVTMEQLLRVQPDVVFNLAFSAHPLEASFAGCLDTLGIPYTGSGPRGIALANDKVRSRHLLRAAGIRVPRFVELAPHKPISVDLEPPLIVKPASLGSAAGIYSDSLVHSRNDIPRLARRIWNRFGTSAVVDEFVVGREFRVGMVENGKGTVGIAGISEWHFGAAAPGWGFKTYAIMSNHRVRRARKVTRDSSTLSRRETASLGAIGRVAMAALDVSGYATFDVRVDNQERVTLLELNANPGLWSESVIWNRPDFESTIRKIVASALKKHQS